MTSSTQPHEPHQPRNLGWLRAAVLGANDGLISTSSLVVGVAAASSGRGPVLLAAAAGTIAGALSMAAGEYVSVSSQADTENASLAKERHELQTMPQQERAELAQIYVGRGLTPALADQVAEQLMAHDALGAHARDELGINDITQAKPLQAALASAASFAVGAVPPVALAALAPLGAMEWLIGGATIVVLAGLGAVAAVLGGAPMGRAALRVSFWGAAAMAATAFVGRIFNTSV